MNEKKKEGQADKKQGSKKQKSPAKGKKPRAKASMKRPAAASTPIFEEDDVEKDQLEMDLDPNEETQAAKKPEVPSVIQGKGKGKGRGSGRGRGRGKKHKPEPEDADESGLGKEAELVEDAPAEKVDLPDKELEALQPSRKKSFARRFMPTSSLGEARWRAVKSAFEKKILGHVGKPSRHEDCSFNCMQQLIHVCGFGGMLHTACL